MENIVNMFHEALDVSKNNYNVHESGKDAGKASFSYKKQLDKNKNKKYNKSIYNEFNTFAMQWRYKFDTKVGDCNIFSVKSDIFALIEATEDGYIEIARGRYKNLKELKQLYEQTYRESIEKLYDDFEKLEADRGADSWDLFNDENGGYGNRDSYRIKESKISSDTSRSYEYSRQNNKAKSTVNKKTNKNFSMNASAPSLDEMKAERSTLQDEYRELRAQIDNLKASAEYTAFDDEIRRIRKNGSLFGGLEAVKEIRKERDEWADESGLTELQKRYHDISDRIHDYDLDIAKNNYNVHEYGKDAGKSYSINQQLTNINIKGYNIDSKSPLSLENRAKANSNSSIKWVYDAEIFSFEESKLFHQKISEINQGFKSFDKNADNEYMIPIGNKIVFTDGNYDSPYIDRIVEVLDEYSTNFEKVKEVIFDVERGKTGYRDAVQLINQVFGNGFIVQYKGQTDGAYGWADRNYKRKNRRAVIADYIRKQNREGNAGEGGKNKNLSYSPQTSFGKNTDSAIDAHYGEVIKELKQWRVFRSDKSFDL